MPRPPAATWNNLTKSMTSGVDLAAQTKTEHEMVKIQIDVTQQVNGDDGSSVEYGTKPDGRGRKTDITFV